MHIDIAKLDRDIELLREEARRLRLTQGKAQWALCKANRFDEIGDFLTEVRREKQMTTVGGKRLTDNGKG